MRRPLVLGAAFLSAILLAGCWEQPVSEKLELDFRKPELIGIHLNMDIASSAEIDNPLVRARADQRRSELALGVDPWDRRFGQLLAEEEHSAVDRKKGEVFHIERYALVDRLNLDKFLADTSISILVSESGDWTDLTVSAARSTRATPRQVAEMRREMDLWCDQVSHYVAAVAELYRYLETNPARAEACLLDVYGPMTEGSDAVRDFAPAELTERETELTSAVTDALTRIDGTLKSYENKSYSLKELVDLVYNPFPGAFSVRVPPRVILVEGFQKKDAELLEVPRPDLIVALESLLDRWVSPDPITWLVKVSDSGEQPDLHEVIAAERKIISVPSDSEVSAAIETKLRPPSTYHVRWQTQGDDR